MQSDFGLNIYDFNNRMYDPAIGRFWQIDPLAEQANQIDKSPFAFSWNNPVLLSDPTGLAPETIYKNRNTGEEVEVNDGVNKTIEVNETDFQTAKEFASIERTEGKFDTGGDAWTQQNQIDYYEFYQSVNSYDEVSLANIYDYFMGGPDDGVIEISPVGGPAGKVGGPVLQGGGRYTFGQLRRALKAAYEKLGVKSLPKGKKGKFGSPQRGDSKKGVRLDSEGHPKTTNPNETGPHINFWDFTKGKRGKGGKSDAVPIE